MAEKLVDLWADSNASNISGFCPPSLNNHGARWIVPLGQCVTNTRLYAAFIIGLSSIAFWFVAQAPQLITNCRSGKADKALSFWFLLQWYAGDTTNLIGAVLTKQLTTQIVAAIYYVIIDTIMMSQFVYYVIKNQGPRGLINCMKCPKRSAVLVLFPCLVFMLVLGGPLHYYGTIGGGGVNDITTISSGRHLLYKPVDQKIHVVENNAIDIVGYTLGCISALFYLGSRIPQIVKNFVRCSTDGLSIPMFVLAVMGNVTYALAVFLVSDKYIFLMRKLPWLIGSVGTLCFDFTVFMQYIFFKFCCKCKTGLKDGEIVPDEYSPLLSGSPQRKLIYSQEYSVQRIERSLKIPVPNRNGQSVISTYYALPGSV